MTQPADLFEVVNPATEEVIETVAMADLAATDAAIARAKAAFESWRRVSPADRARLLRAFAAAVDADREHLAQLEVANAGHTIGNARWEAGNARDVIEYYAAAPERLFGRQIPVAGGIDVTFQEPLGVVGIIVPWNFPLPIAAWGLAPALAAGNTVVLKPAELTPLTALRLAELALAAGLPEGVFQVLPGHGPVVGRRFVTHPDVRKVVFTGSTRVGKEIAAAAPSRSSRSPWNSAARAPTSSSPTPIWPRPPPPRPTPSSTTRARTAAPGPGSWSRRARWTSSWRCWSRLCSGSRWATRARRAPRWGR